MVKIENKTLLYKLKILTFNKHDYLIFTHVEVFVMVDIWTTESRPIYKQPHPGL